MRRRNDSSEAVTVGVTLSIYGQRREARRCVLPNRPPGVRNHVVYR